MFRGASGSYLPAYAISDNNVPHTESWFSLEEWTGNEEPVLGSGVQRAASLSLMIYSLAWGKINHYAFLYV